MYNSYNNIGSDKRGKYRKVASHWALVSQPVGGFLGHCSVWTANRKNLVVARLKNGGIALFFWPTNSVTQPYAILPSDETYTACCPNWPTANKTKSSGWEECALCDATLRHFPQRLCVLYALWNGSQDAQYKR